MMSSEDVEVQPYHRICSLIAISVLMGVGCVWLYLTPDGNDDSLVYHLLCCALLIGFAFGWTFGSMIIVTCQIWGSTFISGNYAALDLAPMAGTLTMATAMAGHLKQKRTRFR